MQAFGSDLKDEDIWAIVSWLRNQRAHEASEGAHQESAEHGAKPAAPVPAAEQK
jgi:cytochrome c oxidase cbb3-type subunit 2